MDYEKKYNEALERARALRREAIEKDYVEDYVKDYETIFPELRESEDERIRKWLADYFGSIKGTVWIHRDITCEQILEWLEKQKPMYNLEIPAGDVAPAEEEGPFDEDEFLENELSAFLQNYDKEYDDDAAVSDVARHFYEIGKKQKEQKPNIEICPHSIKSKSYLEIGYPIENCDYGLEIALNILEQTIGKVQGFQTDDGLREHQTAIKAVKDAMKEQKPEEWSEEDADILNCCISSIEEAKENRYAYKETDGDTSYDREIAFLKSLRPSWKPNDQDELMKLKYAGTSTKLD